MVKKKIGLAGKSGSGKDLVADYICERYGYKKIAVADGIREECYGWLSEVLELYPPDNCEENFWDVVDAMKKMVYEKPTPSGIRVLLQWWGTEYRRRQDSDYWVKRLAERLPENESIVVSDVRLPVEIDTIHNAGGEIWYVNRAGVASVGIPNHLTEIGLDGATFDRTFENDGTIEELFGKVDFLFREC